MTVSRTEKKKVLFIVDKSGFGGVQSIAYALMEYEIPDVEMFFLFLRNVNDRFAMEDKDEPNIFYANSGSRFGVSSFFDLLRVVRKNDIDILHLNGNKAVIFGGLAKMIFPKLKVLAHDHGGVFDYQGWYASFLRFFRSCFAVFIGVSNRRKQFFLNRCKVPPEKIQVVNNFVDPKRFSVQNRKPRLKKDEGHFTVGYLGGLSPVKGCDVLLQAIPRMLEEIPSLKVVVAGDGPSRAELEQMVENLECEDKVSFLGYVSDPAQVYSVFDVMVIPSRAEEGPISLYEAWAMKVPVVASNAPVLDERIVDGKTGLLFASEDSDDLANKVGRLASDSDLIKRLVADGYRQAERLTLARYVEQLRSIYLAGQNG